MKINEVNINPNMSGINILKYLFKESDTVPYDPLWNDKNNRLVGAMKISMPDGTVVSCITDDLRIAVIVSVEGQSLVVHQESPNSDKVIACVPEGFELIRNTSGRLTYSPSGIPMHRNNIWFDFVKITMSFDYVTGDCFRMMINRLKTMVNSA